MRSTTYEKIVKYMSKEIFDLAKLKQIHKNAGIGLNGIYVANIK